MLTIELARRLADAGLTWQPASGDRFVVPVDGMEQDVFVISDLTVDVHHFTTGDVIGFNGTTEWALDSVEQDKVVWLPREEQLRDLLADAFVSLEKLDGGYAVTVVTPAGGTARHADIDAERAYARAVVARLEGQTPEAPAGSGAAD
ncbi:hypothetical protein GCM10023258_36070 [Terrabacter aeriphilus]|uniref:Pilus assembly protein CpaE n=1 Tax=Terrabacter aeriphilus TaxID=515662 RepID=A0ABP9JNJ5_9MICO